MSEQDKNAAHLPDPDSQMTQELTALVEIRRDVSPLEMLQLAMDTMQTDIHRKMAQAIMHVDEAYGKSDDEKAKEFLHESYILLSQSGAKVNIVASHMNDYILGILSLSKDAAQELDMNVDMTYGKGTEMLDLQVPLSRYPDRRTGKHVLPLTPVGMERVVADTLRERPVQTVSGAYTSIGMAEKFAGETSEQGQILVMRATSHLQNLINLLEAHAKDPARPVRIVHDLTGLRVLDVTKGV